MQALIDMLQNIGVVLAFLAARFAMLLVVLAGLAVVFLAGLSVVRLIGLVRNRALGLSPVAGLQWRARVSYAPGHTWLQPIGARILRVGLDDLAQHVLGRISDIVLPPPGTNLRAGDPIAEIRCGRRRLALPSPLSGRVVRVNRRLTVDPKPVHTDPYVRGWLCAVEPTGTDGAELPGGETSRGWFAAEATRLSGWLERELGMAAADGGELVAPGPSLLTDAQWNEMTRTFLQPVR